MSQAYEREQAKKQSKSKRRSQNNERHRLDCQKIEEKYKVLEMENRKLIDDFNSKSKEKERSFSSSTKYKKRKINREKHECQKKISHNESYPPRSNDKPIKTVREQELSAYKNINNYRHIFEKSGVRDENVSWLMGLRELSSNVRATANSNSLDRVDGVTKGVEPNFKYRPKITERLEMVMKRDKVQRNPYKELYFQENLASMSNEIKVYRGSPICKGQVDFESTLRSYKLNDTKINVDHDDQSRSKSKEGRRNWIKNFRSNHVPTYNKHNPLDNNSFFNTIEKFNNPRSIILNTDNSMHDIANRLTDNTNIQVNSIRNISSINDLPKFAEPMNKQSIERYNKQIKEKQLTHPVKYTFSHIDYTHNNHVQKNLLIKKAEDSKETSYLMGAHKADLLFKIEYKEKNLNNIRHLMSTSSNVLCTQFESSLRLGYNKLHDNRSLIVHNIKRKNLEFYTDVNLNQMKKEQQISSIKKTQQTLKTHTETSRKFELAHQSHNL